MTDLVGGVEPERQEWAAGQLARITWSMNVGQLETDVAVRRIARAWSQDPERFWVTCDHASCIADMWVLSAEPLVAVPAGFGERLAQAIEGLRCPCGVRDHLDLGGFSWLTVAPATKQENGCRRTSR